jgi:signal transduction histidine kinase
VASFYFIYLAIINTGFERPFDLLFHNLKKREQELLEQREELEAFAQTASHDLQVPLAVARGYAQTAMRAADAGQLEEMKRCQSRVMEAVDRMSMFIMSLLDHARAGLAGGEISPVNSGRLLRDVLDEFGERLDQGGFAVSVADELPVVPADPVRLEQVFRNLLDNAVKFCDVPEPELEIGCSTEDGTVTFWVRDNGEGIGTEHQEAIFKPFHRGGRTPSDQTGLGVGLATVKRVVEGWGGRIWVESADGAGSTFFFTLPSST